MATAATSGPLSNERRHNVRKKCMCFTKSADSVSLSELLGWLLCELFLTNLMQPNSQKPILLSHHIPFDHCYRQVQTNHDFCCSWTNQWTLTDFSGGFSPSATKWDVCSDGLVNKENLFVNMDLVVDQFNFALCQMWALLIATSNLGQSVANGTSLLHFEEIPSCFFG